MHIGPFALVNNLFVAPMAGVTDRPFRQLCKRLGAGYAVSEMVTSRPDLQDSLKTSRRANHEGEPGPIAVQIAGTDAQMMADAARYNIDRGAQIIDINMGCPAKKVCNKWAGSALMQDEGLALSIVDAVVQACAPRGVPVSLKMRTGWSNSHKNAVTLARLFEAAGVQMLAVHGRTLERDALLPRDEAKALAQFEHEFLQVVDDRLFEIAFAPLGAFGQAEEFEDDRVLHDVLRGEEFLACVGQGEDLVLVAAGGEAFVEVGGDLAF